jgi:hypothetical protein
MTAPNKQPQNLKNTPENREMGIDEKRQLDNIV